MSHVYCPACGFQNPETSNYCAKCGSLLVVEEPGDPTLTLFLGELEGEAAAGPAPLQPGGPALVVRSGGGRTGESFSLDGERVSIGRSPDCGDPPLGVLAWFSRSSRSVPVVWASPRWTALA